MHLPHCPHCKRAKLCSEPRKEVTKFGSFVRKIDNTKHLRYRCKLCKKTFSQATNSPCYRQKKRHHNHFIFMYLASGVSQRRLAINMRVNRKTIVRKFIFLGLICEFLLKKDLAQHPLVTEMQFDDLETFEHSKLKPLSVTMAVEKGNRRILGFRVARMPSKGLLAKKSRKKYGLRKDERAKNRDLLFSELSPYINPKALIESDLNPHYKASIRKHFPLATHTGFLGRRGCVVGQGELKAGGYDPLFGLNHSFAMLRANINRLFRRTWNTTKKPERLDLHISIYCLYHNWKLI